MIRVRSGYFNVNADVANSVCAARVAAWNDRESDDALEVFVSNQLYRMTECDWSETSEIMTGTMWRVRERNLPSTLKDGESEQVGSPLQESSSFAYKPAAGRTLIQYNHHGPRHTVLRAMFTKLGLGEAVTLSPCLIQDAMEKMQDASVVRRIEFSLGDIEGVEPQLRGVPGVGEAISAMRKLDGANIRVEISLGHNAGTLGSDAKEAVRRLTEFTSGVRTVKAGVRETEDSSVQMLDLLGSREIVDMNIKELGREIDRTHLRERLLLALRDHVTSSDDENIEEEVHDDDEA